MKKRVLLFLTLLLTLTLAFAMSSCDDDEHTHTNADPVVENYVKGTCKEGITYDLVVYCVECEEEVSRTETKEASDIHTAGDVTVENVELYDCTVGGVYEAVTKCRDCGKELDRVETEIAAKTEHNLESATVKADYTSVTDCTAEGNKYFEVTCCKDCGTEISRSEAKDLEKKTAHDFKNGACSVCGTLSATTGELVLELNSTGDGYIVTGVTEKFVAESVVLGYYGEGEARFPVVAIAEGAFKDNTVITSVTLGEDITFIGKNAFTGCASLNAIYVSDLENYCNLTVEIDDTAEIPYMTHPLYYARELYVRGELLEKLVIPAGITEIKPLAFFGLTHIKYVSVPADVATIGESAFALCTGMSQLRFSEGLLEIGESAFSGCRDLNRVSFPNSLSVICDSAFTACSDLRQVKFGSGLTEIGDGAFYYCRGIAEINLPDTVTRIGEGAFTACLLIESIRIPEALTEIGEGAFFGCSGLKAVYITDLTKWCLIRFGSYSANPLAFAGELYVVSTVEGEETAELVTELVIDDAAITEISPYAFYGAKSITKVVLAEGITAIRSDAFSNCDFIESVDLPSTLTVIGARAFYGCESLVTVYVPEAEKWEAVEFKDIWSDPMYYAEKLVAEDQPAV